MAGEEVPRFAATRLAQRVVALPEAAMRRVALAEALAAPSPGEAVELLAALLHEGKVRGEHAAMATLATLAGALSDPALIAYPVRQGLYEAALAAGRPDIARLFLGPAPARDDEPAPPKPERPLAPQGRPLTLGERKSLARTRQRENLQKLLVDPDASVIRILLGNPTLTERDVLVVASRRPVRGEVLRVVFDSRWIQQYAVKRALVLNPYTPTDLAVRLLPTLTQNDLRAVAGDPAVAAATRMQAELLVKLA